MAAGINDKFKKTFNSDNPNVTFVTTLRSGGATTLICDNLAGWPTDTAVDFITYQLDTDGQTVVAGSQRDWKGIVSSNTITNLTLIAGGSDAGNSVNDIVEMTPTGNWANDLIEGILVGHDQDGTHKSKGLSLGKINGGSTDGVLLTDSSGNVTVGSVAPSNWTNPYRFRVSRDSAANSGASSAFAKIAFDTEQYDPNNNFASGTYTAPVNGVYHFSYRTKWVTGGAEQVQGALYKNGSPISYGTNLTAPGIAHMTITGDDTIQLSAGDTIDVYVSNSGTAKALEVGATTTYFSGELKAQV